MTDQILRMPAVIEATGLSRTTVWRMSRRGDCPAPVRLTGRHVGWKRSDIERWIDTREPVGGGIPAGSRTDCIGRNT